MSFIFVSSVDVVGAVLVVDVTLIGVLTRRGMTGGAVPVVSRV
jgi:hypothetical protein